MKTTSLYKYLFLLSVFMSIIPVAYSQQDIDSIAGQLQKQFSSKPSELIYLQLSKGIYETGEDLWFKAYQLNAQTFGLSDKSKTLYLQMINSEDSVVWQEKYPIGNGVVSGHLYVDEKLQEGNYFLEGYTKDSFYKNDTIGILSARKIRIVKNISRAGISTLPKDSTFRFEMFPEGGNLVCGVLSKLACKATDGKGNPIDAEGTLYQDNEPLSIIKSTHNGMGAILFTPLQDKKYRIELKNGRSYPLPAIHPEGMALHLSKQGKEQLDFVVSQSNYLPNQSIYLMGQMRGMVCCVAKGILKDNLKITIPLSNFFYQGIAEFTLFNEAMQPIAERLVYLHPDKKLHITAEPDKKSFIIREKATIKIKVTDEKGKPVKANLGVSVYDRAYNNPADPVNMLSYCYLSSQIRGTIYNPAYYFDEENTGRIEAMDLLLLTQGWRRYVWNTDPIYKGQSFLTDEINGIQTIKKKKKNEQNQGVEQLIQVSGAEGNSQFIWADSIGQFTVTLEMMKKLRGGYVYLKPMLTKEFKPELGIVDYFPEIDRVKQNRSYYDPIIDLSQLQKEVILDLPVVSNDSTILLNEVIVTRKANKPFRDKFMGRLDSLTQANLGGAYVCDCGKLQNYISGYDAHPWWMPCRSEKRTKPVEGKSYMLFKYKHLGGNTFSVIEHRNIIYQANKYTQDELLRMNNLWCTKGYYTAREFYQPDEIDIQSSIPDARNTLLWAPTVSTDEKGEAVVSFYCSDINTEFIGLIEGVDGAGLLGTEKCEFRVIRK